MTKLPARSRKPRFSFSRLGMLSIGNQEFAVGSPELNWKLVQFIYSCLENAIEHDADAERKIQKLVVKLDSTIKGVPIPLVLPTLQRRVFSDTERLVSEAIASGDATFHEWH